MSWTPNKAASAAKAREIYVYLTANGWDAALGKFKPKSQVVLKSHATVGDFLDELGAKADLNPKTFVSYAIAFRKNRRPRRRTKQKAWNLKLFGRPPTETKPSWPDATIDAPRIC